MGYGRALQLEGYGFKPIWMMSQDLETNLIILDRCPLTRSGVFTIDFEYMQHKTWVFLPVTVNM